MLSLFPTLFSYSQLGPFLLRVILGATLIYFAYNNLTRNQATNNEKAAGVLEGLSGILLVIGLFTQAAALVAAIILSVRLAKKIAAKAFLTSGINYYLILLFIALSLLVSGAGSFAFDLRL